MLIVSVGGIVMAQKKSNESNESIGFAISQIIIIAFLIVDIYVFINQNSIIAKLLATVSFVLGSRFY